MYPVALALAERAAAASTAETLKLSLTQAKGNPVPDILPLDIEFIQNPGYFLFNSIGGNSTAHKRMIGGPQNFVVMQPFKITVPKKGGSEEIYVRNVVLHNSKDKKTAEIIVGEAGDVTLYSV
ncbi:hypothetical protein TWF694_000373 [Orbilia ellipsospora]|uniref:Uncharacterized protein n=1 Tax=Orbilia ellipsospora TaxID=2528407 RepID=A0AAV9XPA3_9PEZI